MMSNESEERIVVDFLDRFMADRASGEELALSRYLQLYPGHEGVIAREYVGVTGGDIPSRTTAAGDRDEIDDSDDDARIGGFEVLREIGRGGQAVVYLARDRNLNREVALKVLEPGIVRADDVLLRFRREATLTSKLQHPSIGVVYDAGREGRRAWIAMRFVDGDSLAALIDKRAELPSRDEIKRRVVWIEEVAWALHAAHESGVIHRDVKPSNVMVDGSDRPVLLDFGLARDASLDGDTVTLSGAILGTPQYMSPEQFRGGTVGLDRRTDIYSLGVTMFHVLTHELPFQAPTRERLAELVRTAPTPDARERHASVSKDLSLVIATAMEKDLGRRYATAADLAEDLRRVREDRPILARPIGWSVRFLRWIRRNPVLATAAGLLFLALVGGLLLTSSFLRREKSLRAETQTGLERILELSDVRAVDDLLRREDEDLWPIDVALPPKIDVWLDDVRTMLTRRSRHAETRRRLIEEPEHLALVSGEETFDPEWLKSVLGGLMAAFDRLQARVPFVEERRRLADTLRARTVDRVATAWDECIDDIAESDTYDGLEIDPQVGLVPLRRDPQSRLWEFWHPLSGERPEVTDTTGPLVTEAMGMVFVLIPGGTFVMGSDEFLANGRAFRFGTEEGEHELDLAPFFVSKYEMTQAQWIRLDEGRNQSYYFPGTDHGEFRGEDDVIELVNPVENVTWHEADRVCRRYGLTLPTEAQWEYACRAGTRTHWFSGSQPRSLDGYANVVGLESPPLRWVVVRPSFDDGHILPTMVGTYSPNSWGLYDVIGNVGEWTRDIASRRYVDGRVESDDGLRLPAAAAASSSLRVIRGGSFFSGVIVARSASRQFGQAKSRLNDVGLRPARRLTR